ncbi:hypothetical protein ACROYT_G004048 [Oculina patagonica]
MQTPFVYHYVEQISDNSPLNSLNIHFHLRLKDQEASLLHENSASKTNENVKCDVVDGGVKQSASQVQTRLSTNVKEIPLRVYSRVCKMLNGKRERFDDFRMLAEKVGLTRVCVEQLKNPTHEILKIWSWKNENEATVGKLIEFLKEKDLKRWDVVKVLKIRHPATKPLSTPLRLVIEKADDMTNQLRLLTSLLMWRLVCQSLNFSYVVLPASESITYCDTVLRRYHSGKYLFKLWPLLLASTKFASIVTNRLVRNTKIRQIVKAITEGKEDL